MSSVFEPIPLPPSDGSRFRYPIPLPTETRRQTTEETYNEMLLWLDEKLHSAPGEVVPAPGVTSTNTVCRIERREWQHPIYSGNELIDFIDVYAVCENQAWPATGDPGWVTPRTTNTVGFLLVPERMSLRDVVRRVRRMEAHEKCHYVVVSTDGRFQQALTSQGIDFVHYELPDARVSVMRQ